MRFRKSGDCGSYWEFLVRYKFDATFWFYVFAWIIRFLYLWFFLLDDCFWIYMVRCSRWEGKKFSIFFLRFFFFSEALWFRIVLLLSSKGRGVNLSKLLGVNLLKRLGVNLLEWKNDEYFGGSFYNQVA